MTENQFYNDYQSPLGYRTLENGYDTYGVDHSQFTTREEVEYQDKRVKREEELMQQQRNMGITGNYKQYGSDFWSTSPENNYGLGGSEVKPRYWETAQEGKQIYEDVVAHEGFVEPQRQSMNNYINSAVDAGYYMNTRKDILDKNLTDKFKHAFLNCKGAQYGSGGNDMAMILSYGKEGRNLFAGSNTWDASCADNYANKIGRLMGTKYPNRDCDEMLQQYIKKY